MTRALPRSLSLALALAACDTAAPPPEPLPDPICQMTPLPESSGPLIDAPGRLLITSRRDGTSRLYASRPDGSDLRAVTPPGFAAYEGAWSPDGQRVVFAADSLSSTAGRVLYVMSADGSGTPEALRVPPSENLGIFRDGLVTGSFPAWSPDGGRIAFSECVGCEVGGTNSELFVYDLAAGRVTRLTNHPGSDRLPTWSPSGDSIAFQSDRDGTAGRSALNPNLYLLAVANLTSPKALTTDGTGSGLPRWNPTRDLIGYSIGNDIPSLFDLSCDESFGNASIEYGAVKWMTGWSPNSEWTLQWGQERSQAGYPLRRLYAVGSNDENAIHLFSDDDAIDYADWSRQ